MFDLKTINSVVAQLEEERGIPREKTLEAIAMAFATAYKKEYGKKGQIVRASFDQNTGSVEFWQVKIVVERDQVIMEGDEEMDHAELKDANVEDIKIRYNPEQHMLIEDARRIKKGAAVGDELTFPLEMKADFGRIAAQTAKQIIIQKIREAEKVSVMGEYGEKEGEVVAGTVERVERGIVYIDMGRAVGVIPYEEQIPSERWKTGDRIRAYLYAVEETPRGIVLKLSRAHPKFLAKLFETEAPEIAAGTVEIKAIAREAGSRSKVAVVSHDPHIDPIGSMVGQRGVRVSTVTSELSGEKIDIVEWNEDPALFIEEALSPAEVVSLELIDEQHRAIVTVTEDEQSLAIGKGGQNVRLAAKLTGWKIDIKSVGGEDLDEEEPGDEDEAEVVAEVVEEKAEKKAEEKVEAKAEESKTAEKTDEPKIEAGKAEETKAEAPKEKKKTSKKVSKKE
jgi:N utilization substance protein A